jgi:hypothetical protein
MKKILISLAVLVTFILTVATMTFYYKYSLNKKNSQIKELQHELELTEFWLKNILMPRDILLKHKENKMNETYSKEKRDECEKLIFSFFDKPFYLAYIKTKTLELFPKILWDINYQMNALGISKFEPEEIDRKFRRILRNEFAMRENIKCLKGEQMFEDYEKFLETNNLTINID